MDTMAGKPWGGVLRGAKRRQLGFLTDFLRGRRAHCPVGDRKRSCPLKSARWVDYFLSGGSSLNTWEEAHDW